MIGESRTYGISYHLTFSTVFHLSHIHIAAVDVSQNCDTSGSHENCITRRPELRKAKLGHLFNNF